MVRMRSIIIRGLKMLSGSLSLLQNFTIPNGSILLKNTVFSFIGYRKYSFYFSSLKPSDRQSSQSLLKQYFSTRLTLSTTQLQSFLLHLSKNNDVKIRDHRWQSLFMTVQKYHQDFSLQSKIEIIHALGRMKQNNQLFITLYRSIIAQFHKLTSRQMAILLWSMVKADQNDKTIVMAIYKKLYKILKNNQKIKLYKEGQQLPHLDPNQTDINGQQIQSIHHMHEANFVHLIWALQKTRIIDEKLILDLLKHTFQDKELKNLQKVRVENLCLLAHCIEEMQFQKFRISQTIINQIVQSWQSLQSLSILSLVLLCESFTNFVHYQQQYLNRYEKNFTSEEIEKKKQFIGKQKRFIFLIAQTILLKQDCPSNRRKHFKRKFKKDQPSEDLNELQRLMNPLSSKFASQIIFNLGKLNLYDKKIWYKLLTNITDNIDQAEAQDLSMTLTGICNLLTKEIPSEDIKSLIYQQKRIISRRCFQIYTSLSGKSLQKIKELIYQRKIQNQFVPSRIRKEVQQQFIALKMKENEEKHYSQDQETQNQEVKTNNSDQQTQQKHPDSEKQSKRKTSSQKQSHKRAESLKPQ